MTAPVVPRPAASVLVLRERPEGPEVLMGLRGAHHRFMPNRLVFPGGAVDPEDFAAPHATPPSPALRRRLEVAADPALAAALAAAAARELEEETGLTLGAPPRLDGLCYLCRAITPADRPLRFDARFLVLAETALAGALAGSGELESLRYYPVEEALALDLALVTRGVLQRFLEWRALAPSAREQRARTPVLHEFAWGEE